MGVCVFSMFGTGLSVICSAPAFCPGLRRWDGVVSIVDGGGFRRWDGVISIVDGGGLRRWHDVIHYLSDDGVKVEAG